MQADDPKGFAGNRVLDHSGVSPVLRVKLAVLMGLGLLYKHLCGGMRRVRPPGVRLREILRNTSHDE